MRRRRLVVSGIVVGGAALAVAIPATRSDAAPNQVIQHQGKLVDSNGVPLQGSFTVRFRIYRSQTPSAADFVWGERHSLVLNRGVYTARLGAGEATLDAAGNETSGPHPFTDEFDAGDPRWIEVQVGTDPPLSPLSQIGAVPFSIASAGTVPIGTVIAWWPPAPGAGVPAAYEYCDGTKVVTEGPLKGLTKPDLMSTPRFVRGIAMSELGSLGGDQHHYDGTDDADHRHDLAPGGTALQTSVAGDHDHGGSTGFEIQHEDSQETFGELLLTFANRDHDHSISSGGGHSHTISGVTGDVAESTPLGRDNRPAFVSLAYIVRVR